VTTERKTLSVHVKQKHREDYWGAGKKKTIRPASLRGVMKGELAKK